MTKIQIARKFDDRVVDFASGKKVSPPMSLRRICDCCGQRLVKGALTNLGTLGDDCTDVALRAQRLGSLAAYAESQRRIGWGVKPAVARFLQGAGL